MIVPPLLKYIGDEVFSVLGPGVTPTTDSTLHTCGGTLRIYTDHVFGKWLHCRDCGFAGDMIDAYRITHSLADTSAVVQHIKGMGIKVDDRLTAGNAIQRYSEARLAYARLAEWYAGMVEGPGSRHLLNRCLQVMGLPGVPHGTPMSDLPWMAGGTKRQIADICKELGLKEFTPVASKRAVKSFCAVVPIYDLPGRLSGMYVIDRESIRIHYIATRDGVKSALKPQGIALCHDIDEGAAAVYTTDNIVLALCMKYRRHLFSPTLGLPIVAGPAGIPPTMFKAMSPQSVVHVTGDLTEDVVENMAGLPVKSWVATLDVGMRVRQVATYIRKTAEIDTLRRVGSVMVPLISAAKPHVVSGQWLEALAAISGNSSAYDALKSACSMAEWETLAAARSDGSAVRTSGGDVVRIKPDGYFMGAARLTNYIVALREFGSTSDLSVSIYRGVVTFGGVSVPFDLSIPRCDSAKLIAAIGGVMRTRGYAPYTAVSKYRLDFISVIMEANSVKPTAVTDSVGWNPGSGSYDLPGIRLLPGSQESCICARPGGMPYSPLADFDVHDVPPMMDVLSRTTAATSAFWSVFLWAVHNIIAPEYSRPVMGLLACHPNPSSRVISQWCRDGLGLTPVGSKYAGAVLPAYADTVEQARSARVFPTAVLPATSVIVPAHAHAALTSAYYSGWMSADCTPLDPCAVAAYTGCFRLITGLLMHHQKTKSDYNPGVDLCTYIVRSLESFLKTICPPAILAEVYAGLESSACDFKSMSDRGCSAAPGLLAWRKVSVHTSGAVTDKATTVTLNVSALNRALALLGCPEVPVGTVAAMLLAQGLLIDGDNKRITIPATAWAETDAGVRSQTPDRRRSEHQSKRNQQSTFSRPQPLVEVRCLPIDRDTTPLSASVRDAQN